MADPNWRGGDYYASGEPPTKGLAVARMAAHITYLSEAGLTEKFGRQLQDREAKTFGFDRSEERRVGKEWSVRVDIGGRRIIKKKNKYTASRRYVTSVDIPSNT